MRLIDWSALVVFLTLCSPSHAQESIAAAACIALGARAADARLNETYRRAVAMIDKSGSDNVAEWKAELKPARQAWIVRDADCGALVG